jgi:hypothetical protein
VPKTPISKIDVVGATTALQPVHSDTAMYSFASRISETVDETEAKGYSQASQASSPVGSNRSTLSMLLSQFQTRYPTTHLTAELLMIHEGSYVVRALVQTDGIAIASSMAANPDIEQAEDRAKVRVLELLIQPSAANPSILPNEILSSGILSEGILSDGSGRSTPLISGLSSEITASEITTDIPLSVSEDFPAMTLEASSNLGTNWSDMPLYDPTEPEDFLPPEVEITPDQTLLPQDSVIQTPDSIKSDSIKDEGLELPTDFSTSMAAPSSLVESSPVSTTSTIDLSDAIAQTTVELKRLGWTNAQGRNHLDQTYGKRSRQQLTDAELLDFLAYLESQPSPSQTPF